MDRNRPGKRCQHPSKHPSKNGRSEPHYPVASAAELAAEMAIVEQLEHEYNSATGKWFEGFVPAEWTARMGQLIDAELLRRARDKTRRT